MASDCGRCSATAIVSPAMPPAPEGKKPDNKKSFGTGFFVSSEGHIVTNSHVVEDCSSVQVTLGLAPKMAGRIMTQDFANDLALIRVEAHPAAFASLRSGVRLGESVGAFGFPRQRRQRMMPGQFRRCAKDRGRLAQGKEISAGDNVARQRLEHLGCSPCR